MRRIIYEKFNKNSDNNYRYLFNITSLNYNSKMAKYICTNEECGAVKHSKESAIQQCSSCGSIMQRVRAEDAALWPMNKHFLLPRAEDILHTLLNTINIKIVNKSNNEMPVYATKQSAGCDLRANISEEIILKPLQRVLVKTGLSIELPEGYEAQIRPRSGLAYKHGISIVNAPGTIDADYRGDVGVLLINLSDEDYTLKPGERIAQMVIAKYVQAIWEEVKSLSDTQRGTGGYGSTGKQ